MEFENLLTHNGIHYSRYIASWEKATGLLALESGRLFKKWLKETQELTDDEIRNIWLLASNGKLELESSARTYYHKWHKENVG